MRNIAKQFGPQRYRERMQQALTSADGHEAVLKVEMATRLAESFLTWPERRLGELEKPKAPETQGRGGYH